MRALRNAGVVAVALVFGWGAGPLRAQSGPWDADDRVLIADFSVVTALARSSTQLFAATGGGLVVVDDAFGDFELPITVEDGYPHARVTALAFDHRDRSVWLAAGGDLLQLDPLARRFRDRIRVRQPVDELIPAEASGSDLFFRAGRDWWRLDTFRRDVRRAAPEAVRAAIEGRSDLRRRSEILRDDFFRDALDRVARDWDGRRLGVTDVAAGRASFAWWIGTAGGFLIEYDDGSRQGSRRSYGPVGQGMAAVATWKGSTWFAPREPRDGRYGLGLATADLQDWSVWRADSAATVPSGVRVLLAGPDGTWAGGEAGLHWIDPAGERWTEVRGIDLPVRPVLSLAEATAPDDRAVWVGTSRGLLRLMSPAGPADVSLLEGDAVTAVAEGDGVVWIGTAHGLYGYELPRADSSRAAAARVAGPSALRLPVGAIAVAGDTVFAGLEREVWWRPGRGAGWRRVNAVGRMGGPVTALALYEGVLWAGSTADLSAWAVGRADVRRFVFGRDLPPDARGRTGVWDIAPLSRSEVWLALPSGALRFQTGF